MTRPTVSMSNPARGITSSRPFGRGWRYWRAKTRGLTPIRIFDYILQHEFNMTARRANANRPMGHSTLKPLGFFPDESDTIWRYEQREERFVSIEILRPEGGKE